MIPGVIGASVAVAMMVRLCPEGNAGGRVDRVTRRREHVQQWLPDLKTDLENHGHRLLSLALHQTPRTAAHHGEEDAEKLAAVPDLSRGEESRGDTAQDLVVLLRDGWEIDEKSAAHVRLELFHSTLFRRFETIHEQRAVLQEASSTDLLWVGGVYEPLVQVTHGLIEVWVHRDGVNGREKLGRGSHWALLGTPPVREIVVQTDLERVDGKLKLSPDLVHEFEFDASMPVFIAEREQGPLNLGCHHEHHLPHVRLLQKVSSDASLRGFLGEKLQQGRQNLLLDDVEIPLTTAFVDRYAENQVDVVEFQLRESFGVRLTQAVAGRAAVHANVLDINPLLEESLSDDLHDGGRRDLQDGEIAARVLRG